MVGVQVTVSDKAVKKALGSLQSKSGVVISRAANRAMGTAEKVIRDETAAIYEINKREVSKDLKRKKATVAKPTAILTYKSAHKNLFWWKSRGRSGVSPARPVQSSSPFNPDPKYYSAHVMRGRGNIPLNSGPRPFVQIAKSGVIGLFRRTSDHPRSPIRGVAAPALTQIIQNDKVLDRLQKETGIMLQKRIEHEVDYLLKL